MNYSCGGLYCGRGNCIFTGRCSSPFKKYVSMVLSWSKLYSLQSLSSCPTDRKRYKIDLLASTQPFEGIHIFGWVSSTLTNPTPWHPSLTQWIWGSFLQILMKFHKLILMIPFCPTSSAPYFFVDASSFLNILQLNSKVGQLPLDLVLSNHHFTNW